MENPPPTREQFTREVDALRRWEVELRASERRREKAEEALRKSESARRALLSATPDILFRISKDGAFLDFVPAKGGESFALPEALIGKRVDEFMPPDVAREIMSLIACALQTGDTQVMGYQLTVSGQIRSYQARIAVSDEDEVLAIVRDITAQKRLEEQLLQSQRMESIGRLVGGVAHDFCNLLTAIMGYVQVATTELPPGGGRNLLASLQGIQRASEHASILIRQLLAFSRPQGDEPRLLSLSDLILDMDGLLRRLIGEDIELVTLPAPSLGVVRLDPGQMEQVLINMAVNARDAMPTGGRLIIKTSDVILDDEYARQRPQFTAGEYVALIISDTGIGMTDEVMADIFEPFYTTKKVEIGTGLGLSTCREIVSRNGGHITVESEVGVGTTFRICLPRVEEATVSTVPAYGEWDNLPEGTQRVLLVEDEPLMRDVTSKVLREQGYTVLEAPNGLGALRIAEAHANEEIHLLLTDVVMPLMGGRELAERLKGQRPEMAVLYTSGYGRDDRVRPNAVGTNGHFIQKPFTPAALVNKVRDVLDRQQVPFNGGQRS